MSRSNVLIDLMYRLEAATSRLEDIAQSTIDPSAALTGPDPGAALVGQGAQSVPLPPAQAPPPPEPLPQAIGDFDGLINGDVQKYVSLSERLGGLVAEQVRS
jgi:adenylyl cyclase-associated protein